MNQLPRLASIPYHVRKATSGDVDACQRIARQHSQALGFVRRDSLLRGVNKGELFVADRGGEVVGFVSWHGRRDGWQTVYEIATDKRYQGIGIGRALLYAVPCPVRLKCPVDNASNAFYKGAGLQIASVEKGRKRDLNVWELRALAVLVAGDNKRYPGIARQAHMAYGTRHTEKPHDKIFMLDVEWERFKKRPDEWSKYMALVRKYRPVMAMCVDYEYPWQRRALLRQIHDLRRAGVLRILICPKFNGAIDDIPQDCIVAISVPTNYAGFLPDFRELKGRCVHLLGGSPLQQTDLIPKIAGHGATVISVDGNGHLGAAQRGSTYVGGGWKRKSPAVEPANQYVSALISSVAIQREVQTDAVQIPLGI